MTQHATTSHRSVALAALALLLAAVAFGAAFYVLDGMSVVAPLVDDAVAFLSIPGSQQPQPAPRSGEATSASALKLPEGMPESFALRIWQEQLESQQTISRLVNGEIESLTIKSVDIDDDLARLHVTVAGADGGNLDGVIGLRRYADTWYVAYASSQDTSQEAGGEIEREQDSAPVKGADLALLNTVLAENRKSASVVDEYVDGTVKRVNIGTITPGPQTATLAISMDETHGVGYANLVAIKKPVNGKDAWFLARFTKTGDKLKP